MVFEYSIEEHNMKEIVGILLLLFCTSCKSEKISGEYELSKDIAYYDTPVLPLPQYLTLDMNGNFSSSLPLHGSYEIANNMCKLTDSSKRATIHLYYYKCTWRN